jgi:hypothetical protein
VEAVLDAVEEVGLDVNVEKTSFAYIVKFEILIAVKNDDDVQGCDAMWHHSLEQ